MSRAALQMARSEADTLRGELAEALSEQERLEADLKASQEEVSRAVFFQALENIRFLRLLDLMRPSLPNRAICAEVVNARAKRARSGCCQVAAREEEVEGCQNRLEQLSAEVRNVKALLSSSLQPRIPSHPLPRLISLDCAAASSRSAALGRLRAQQQASPSRSHHATAHGCRLCLEHVLTLHDPGMCCAAVLWMLHMQELRARVGICAGKPGRRPEAASHSRWRRRSGKQSRESERARRQRQTDQHGSGGGAAAGADQHI